MSQYDPEIKQQLLELYQAFAQWEVENGGPYDGDTRPTQLANYIIINQKIYGDLIHKANPEACQEILDYVEKMSPGIKPNRLMIRRANSEIAYKSFCYQGRIFDSQDKKIAAFRDYVKKYYSRQLPGFNRDEAEQTIHEIEERASAAKKSIGLVALIAMLVGTCVIPVLATPRFAKSVGPEIDNRAGNSHEKPWQNRNEIGRADDHHMGR